MPTITQRLLKLELLSQRGVGHVLPKALRDEAVRTAGRAAPACSTWEELAEHLATAGPSLSPTALNRSEANAVAATRAAARTIFEEIPA